jgi:NAD-dependent DNA ligase
VQLEQTFQVVRPSANLSSETQIAEIRVKELLRGNVARCRVDSLNDPNVYPAAGDLIKNPNFSARQYKKWALVGTFGGTFSKHTRQQLTDILRRTGFQVVDKMDLTVDAVIIGGNWRDGPEWQKAKEWQLNVETYPEEEVLHFLGLTGPDRR